MPPIVRAPHYVCVVVISAPVAAARSQAWNRGAGGEQQGALNGLQLRRKASNAAQLTHP